MRVSGLGAAVMTPLDPDPLYVPDDDPRVPSPWQHQRQRAMERERIAGRREGCVVYLLAALFGLLVIAVIVAVIAAPRAAADPTSTAPRDLSGLRAAASGGPLPGAPSVAASQPALGQGTTAATRGGAPSPSPAVANVATSEGSSGPTTPMPATTSTGYAGWAVPGLGSRYLAVRLPRGTLVTLCGPAACWTTRTTDYGPSSRIRPSRVADIAVGQWERACGLSRRYGLCEVTIVVVRRP